MKDENENIMQEPQLDYEKGEVVEPNTSCRGFVHMSEDEKLLANINRPDIEKLQLFTRMLRRNKTLKSFKFID
jgi:hypothetical protein